MCVCIVHGHAMDTRAVKVLFLVARDDGRSPLLDPATQQPLIVRAAARLEDGEAVLALLARAARRIAMPLALPYGAAARP